MGPGAVGRAHGLRPARVERRAAAVVVASLWLAACAAAQQPAGAPAQASAAAHAPSAAPYSWQSPNGWKVEKFKLPPKRFAPDLGFVGTEVLHFSPGYFKGGDKEHWTYAFTLFVQESEPISQQRLLRELHTYFVGLGSHLGKAHSPELAASTVSLRPAAAPTAAEQPLDPLDIDATVLDPWATGAPVDLRLKVYVKSCPGTSLQAVTVLASQHPYEHPLWSQLASEQEALRCGKR